MRREISTSAIAATAGSKCSTATGNFCARSRSMCPSTEHHPCRHRQQAARGCQRHTGAGCALGDLYHAGTEADSLQRGRLSRAHLQVDSGRHAAWRARRSRQTAQTVRLDSRDGLPVGKRALRRRSVKLARAEIDSSPRPGNRHGALRRGSIGDFVVGRAKIFRRDLNALSVEAQHLDVMTLVSASFRSVPWHKHWPGMEHNLYA